LRVETALCSIARIEHVIATLTEHMREYPISGSRLTVVYIHTHIHMYIYIYVYVYVYISRHVCICFYIYI
jgi:hypothetical protein